METKVCKGCGKEFPATKEHFYTRPGNKDGLNGKCKTCVRFGPRKEKEIIPEGFKKCNKCASLLPATEEYFRLKKDMRGKYLLYYICRDCEKQDKHDFKQAHKEEIAKYNAYYRSTHKDYFKNYYNMHYKGKHRLIKKYKTIKSNDDINYNIKSNTEKKSAKICLYCGHRFTPVNKKQKYCTKDCAINSIKESKIKIEPAIESRTINMWHVGGFNQNIKDLVLERDNHQCYICGKETNLHVHHIIPRAHGGTHTLENLVTLCGACHRTIETGDVENAVYKCVQRAIKNIHKK
jgi:hypothetical protein